jgi:oxalate---CoA ligase
MTDTATTTGERPQDTVAGLLGNHGTGPSLVTVDGDSIDNDQLVAHVELLAERFRAAGLGPGDRIAIVLPNGPDMALVLLAAMSVGCAAPLNPKYREDEFRFYLDDLRAGALVTNPGERPAAHAAAPASTMAIDISGTGLSIDLDLPPEVRPRRDGVVQPDDQGLVLHTSGTTSRPKIVPLRQRNLAGSARNIAAHLRLTPDDRSLNVMPLFHIHGIMAGLLAPLSAGASVVCTPGFDAFKFHRWVDELQPTYYTAVPTMHQMVLARAPKERRATTLRFVRSSSASLPAPVLGSLTELFGVPVVEAYGMTEASHQMTSNPLPPGAQKVGSVGQATGIEVAILDAAGDLVPAGQRGEVSIRGASVVDGYENNPEANASAYTNSWFRTGDEGTLDAEGYLFLTGRLKEQINRGGEKISPLEVDDALLRHPSVAEAVTFGIPHFKLGEEVGAVVVVADGQALTERELRTFAGQQLAAFKVPDKIIFVDEIPKGATGKVQRIGMAGRLGL